MTRQFKIFLAVALLGLVASSAQAGTFTLTPNIVAAYSPGDFASLPIPDISTNQPGTPVVLEVQVVMNVVSLDAGERGFANTGFNIVFGGNTSDDADAGWQPDIRNGDSNGAAGGGAVPLWATNVDAGVVGDEEGILVAIAGGLTGANDNRRNIGQAPGSVVPAPTGTNPYPTGEIGSFFVLWDGVGGDGAGGEDYIELSGIKFQAINAQGQFTGLFTQDPVRITLGVAIPEPSTIAMGGLSLIGLAFRRRAA